MTSIVGLDRTALLCCALAAACASSSSVDTAATRPAATKNVGFCGAVEAALGASGTERGFRCLRVPNFLVTGFYGTRDNPERSDFANACFGGDPRADERLKIAVRPTSELRLALRSESRVSSDGGLDLGFLGPWAPRIGASSARDESVDVTVELADAEIRVLSSVAEILGQEWSAVEEKPEGSRALEACLDSLCSRKKGDGALVYTAKVLAAVPVIRIRFDSQTASRGSFKLAGGTTGFEVKQSASDATAVEIRGKDKLNVAALLEDAEPAFERAETCKRLRETRARREVVMALRQLGLRTLSERELDRVPVSAAELRSVIGRSEGAFNDHEQRDLLRCLEGLEGASRDLSAQKPTRALCGARNLLESVLTSGADGNRLHDVLTDVTEPLHRRLTDLANEHALPCAEPVWFRDEDGDGYGDPRVSQRAAKQPAGYVINSLDCFDRNRDAHPGQLKFFLRQRGDGSFDYDCDGAQTPEAVAASGGCKSITRFAIPTRCWPEPGWIKAAPACGFEGRWFSKCELGTLSCDEGEPQSRVQGCR